MIRLNDKQTILNWAVMPLVRIVLLIIIGIYLATCITIPLTYLLGTWLLLFSTAYLINNRNDSDISVLNINSVVILLLFICTGSLVYALHDVNNDKYHFKNQLTADNYIVGVLIQEIKKKKSSYSTLMKVESVDGKPVRGKLLIYFNKSDSLISYSPGDKVAILGTAREIASSKNPRGFDYQNHMAKKGIVRQVFLKSAQHSLVNRGRLFLPLHYAYHARKWAQQVLQKRLSNKDEYATASAMVLGNRDHISDELQTAFSDTGAVHVLAVSGLHVGIVIMLFNFLFRKTRSESKQSKKVIKFTVLSIVVIAYALITGASPAVVRASIMFSTLLFGRLWFDNTNIYNILAFSAIVILMYNPNYLFDLGFIFSYLALISIVFFQPLFMRWLELYYEPIDRLSIRTTQLITVSLAAQVLIFPVSIHYFHKFPIYFIISGVIAVAMAPFILGCGLILIMTCFVPVWNTIVTGIFSILLRAFLLVIYGIQSLPFNSIENVWISKSSMIYLYIIIIAVMWIISNQKTEYERYLNPKNTGRNWAALLSFFAVFGLVGNSIYHSYKIKNHSEMIVHNINGGTLIDIYEGKALFSIQSADLDRTQLKYACRDNRIYHGNPEPIMLPYDKNLNSKIATKTVHLSTPSIHYANKHILYLTKVTEGDTIPQRSDVILITHRCEMFPYDLLKVHDTDLVVLDASISYGMINRWKKECKKRNISIHSTREDGAFILNPN